MKDLTYTLSLGQATALLVAWAIWNITMALGADPSGRDYWSVLFATGVVFSWVSWALSMLVIVWVWW